MAVQNLTPGQVQDRLEQFYQTQLQINMITEAHKSKTETAKALHDGLMDNASKWEYRG